MSRTSLTRTIRQQGSSYYRQLENYASAQWLFLAPATFLLALVVAIPLITGILLSFTEYNITFSQTPTFVGIGNYVTEVVTNGRFINATLNTLVFVVGAVTVEFVLGFGLALLLRGRFRGRGLFRAVILTPMFIAPVAVGLTFRFLFNGRNGIVPYLLKYIGFGDIGWFVNPTLALLMIVIADVWQWTPYMAILLLAGLEALPTDPYEAAKIDGASRIEQFVEITLPLMRPVIAAAIVVRTIDAFKVFAKVYTMTNGGPGTATETLTWYIYKEAFQNYHIGIAASQAVTVLLMVVGLGYVQTYMIGSRGESRQ